MTHPLKWAKAFFAWLTDLASWLGGLIIIFMALSISYGAISRYAFHRALAWITEVSAYSLLFVAFLGAATVLQRDEHVNVDILLNALRPRARTMFDLVSGLLGLGTSLLLLWYGLGVTRESYRTGQLEVSILQVPKHYLLGVIPLGSLLLCVVYLGKIKQYWRLLREPERNESQEV